MENLHIITAFYASSTIERNSRKFACSFDFYFLGKEMRGIRSYF